MPDRIGQQLGNYRLLRLLGRGGFAEVYLGEHIYLKRRAALKVLHTSLEDDDVDKFLAEAQILARLDHPNIVRVHEFAVEHGTPFLVMDYAPRGTLRQRHPRGSCLSLETTVAYVQQIAAALQYAHNHQLIHRDVKPENILLASQQSILLSDFGISLFSPSPEQLSTQGHEGTIPYMAPEQIRGKPTFASDQYALGILVYEWLCGMRPFEGSQLGVAYQQVADLPPPLRTKDPSLSQEIEDVVLKALAKDPKDRYVSVQLFVQALERASQVSRLDLHPDAEVTAPLGRPTPTSSITPPVTSKGIFVSAAHEDDPFVASLKADLQQHGVAVLQKDPDSTLNKLEQENAVRQAIRAVDVVLLVASPYTRTSSTVKKHLRIASLYQRRLVFVWAAGEDITAVLPSEWGKTVQIDLVDAREQRYEGALDEIVAYLEEKPLVEEPTPTEPAGEPRNPYKGLRAFRQDDATDFFGRDTLVQELVDRVQHMLTPAQPSESTARMLTVIGPSGSGKSSVVMAGLLPHLQRDTATIPASQPEYLTQATATLNTPHSSQQWVYLQPIVPGTHPLEALALTLAPHFPDRSLKTLREDLEDDTARGLHLLATHLVKAPGQQVVLFIDQFEELFTLTTSEEERQQFIDLLVTAMTEPQGPVIVLLTLRADFYDRPIAYPELGRLIVGHQFVMWPMEMSNLRAAIKRPAILPDVQLSFEGSLVGDLLFELQGQAGALPLLQFTLDQLFQRRNGHTLTLEAYREIGGIKGALAKHAESTYTALPSEEHRKLARALFLRLIDPGITEQDTTRRRAALSELSLPDPAQTSMLRETTDAFIAARLLTTNEIAGTTTVEVSHEALIREWARLSGWMREAREDIPLQQGISRDVAEWQQRNKPKDRLYRGSQLKEARTWATRNIPSSNEAAFLQASAAQRMRFIASVLAIVLLLVSTTGVAGDLLLHLFEPALVTNLQDDGVGSLRQAIALSPPGSTITFSPVVRGTIMLTSDLPIANKNLTIRGPGAHLLTISNSTHQVFVFSDASIHIFDLTFKGSKSNSTSLLFNKGTLTLTNSIISGNSASRSIGSLGGIGGGIYNDFRGKLTLTNSTVSDNSVSGQGGGGGIGNDGTLTLTNSTVSGNMASLYGGGIANGNAAMLTLNNSIISGNTVSGQVGGGGIANGSTLILNNSIVSGNIASGQGSSGGGILNFGTLTLTNSTVSGNIASGQGSSGGGILNFDMLTLTNSTISGNTATQSGGGILIQNISSSGSTRLAQADLIFCTIYGNKAPSSAEIAIADVTISPNGDIKPSKQVSQVKISNSIIAGDSAHPGLDISGTLTSNGFNLIQDPSGATFAPNQQHSTDISVDPHADLKIDAMLRDNRGPTKTLALLPSSPALDKIPLSACQPNSITTDQRGMKRPDENESACDIGAYESSP